LHAFSVQVIPFKIEVWFQMPMSTHLLKLPNVVCTPHVASRTYESVVRQATCAVKNLILAMNGEKPIAQVNPEVGYCTKANPPKI
jgi:phosphoglycerate dehydrogenase-like enzyme